MSQRGKCYLCGGVDHYKNKCPNNNNSNNANNSNNINKNINVSVNAIDKDNGKEKDIICYSCGGYGHSKKECPNIKSELICYACKGRGHYKEDCPTFKKSKICYSCGGTGHYQDRCPIKLKQQRDEEERIRKEAQEKQKNDDMLWMSTNMPDQNKTVANSESIKKFFAIKEYRVYFNLHTPTSSLKCSYSNGKINNYVDTSIGRYINNMSINDFITFIGLKGIFTKLEYIIEIGKTNMLYTLSDDAKIIHTQSSGNGKHCSYMYQGEKIASWYGGRGDNELTIYNEPLIKQLYTSYVKTTRDPSFINIVYY